MGSVSAWNRSVYRYVTNKWNTALLKKSLPRFSTSVKIESSKILNDINVNQTASNVHTIDDAALHKQISVLRNRIKKMKAQNCDQAKIDEAMHEINEVKKQLSSHDYPSLLKTAKGTRDYGPKEMTVRNEILNNIITIFKRHGAVTIDSPVFELNELLTSKYGEQSKLIYNLADQGGELLSLRYDLTIPFARYLAMRKITNIKRYHIGKVYRRDDPVMTKGRCREFLQCDFDIAGKYDAMLPEVECVRVGCEIISSVNVGNFYVKINHRLLLNALFQACKISDTKFKTICSSIDKLDRESWETVRKEMIQEKGLTEEQADAIGIYVRQNGGIELVNKLLNDNYLLASKETRVALEEIKLFLHYCELYQIKDKVRVDLSLARGLDYYTGLIYEIMLESYDKDKLVGSVAAGGRYDDLVTMFDTDSEIVPSVGISIGIERLFSVIEDKGSEEKNDIKVVDTQVYVVSAQRDFVDERIKICCELWNNNISAEHSYKKNPRLLKQFHYCEKHQIPFAVIIGPYELQNHVLKIRDIQKREDEEIPRNKLIEVLREKLKI